MKRTCSKFAAFNTSSVCWVLPCKALSYDSAKLKQWSQWSQWSQGRPFFHPKHAPNQCGGTSVPSRPGCAPVSQHHAKAPEMPFEGKKHQICDDLLMFHPLCQRNNTRLPKVNQLLFYSPGLTRQSLKALNTQKKSEEKRPSTVERRMRYQQASTPHLEALPWHSSSPDSSSPCSWSAHKRPHPAKQPSKDVMRGVGTSDRTTLNCVNILVGINSRFLSIRDLKNDFQTRKLESKPCAVCSTCFHGLDSVT